MAMKETDVDRKYEAVTNGTCKVCDGPYKRGDWIVRLGLARFAHLDCRP